MSEYIMYNNKPVQIVATAVNKEFIETIVFSNAVYAIYATKEWSGTGYKYHSAVAVQRESIDTMLTINYPEKGYFSIDLQRFLPATKKDMKTLFTAIEKGINSYNSAEQLYNYISDKIRALQVYRSNSNSATEKNKYTAEIKKYISCCDCVCSEYGFDSVSDTEVKQLPKLKKSEVYIYSVKTNSGAGNYSLYAVPGYTFDYSGFTFSIHHTNHKPDYNSADIMQPVKGSYYTISVGGIKAYQEYKTAKEALRAFVNDSTIIDRLKKAFTSDRTIAMFNSIKEYATANNITLPDNFFPVVSASEDPETMNNDSAINQQNITSDKKPETATEAAEQTTEATEEQPATAVNTVYQEEQQPATAETMTGGTTAGIIKAVLFYRMIIATAARNTVIPGTAARKSPKTARLQCLNALLYQYTTTAKTARIRANSKLKTAAFIVIATGNRSSPQQRNRQIVHYFQTIQIVKAYANITELLHPYCQNY